MSEGGGEGLGPPYQAGGGYPSSQPPTPSSTVPDIGTDPNSKSSSSSGLPPFSSFTAAELAEGLGSRLGPEGFGTEAYPGRMIDFGNWGYYDEGLGGRLLDRGDGLPVLIPQPQYRPWESKDSQGNITKISYDYPGSPASKLPSFQSQFNAFPPEQNGETISLTTLTPAPPSPTPGNTPGLPSFHTLSTVTVNPRGYPLVPAPVQAREIPTIQQQFLDERHIHLFQSPPTLNNTQYHQLGITSGNPSIIQGNFVTGHQNPQQATLLTVVKTEPVAIVTTQLHQQGALYQNANNIVDHESIKLEENSSPRILQDSRKKERRKIRTSSLEIENESMGNSNVESSGQVAAISSTAGFKSPMMQNIGSMTSSHGQTESEDGENNSEKQTKKKRKRCGECIGCQRKDNCGDCAPCRNDKSHQICKMRRCEKLTDKKHLLYLTNEFPHRTESRRGRGKGSRGYRNKGSRGGGNSSNSERNTQSSQQSSSSSSNSVGSIVTQPSAIATLNGEPSPTPMMSNADHTTPNANSSPNDKNVENNVVVSDKESVKSDAATLQPFYGTGLQPTTIVETASVFPPPVREHRFPNTVWQQAGVVPAGDPTIGGWTPQGQYIQQLPPHQVEELRYHPQYAASVSPGSPYTQPAQQSGYPQPQTTFLQSNGSAYQQTSQPPAASPLMNGGSNTSRPNSTVNGSVEYADNSSRSEYVNGAYTGQESILIPQPSSTPNSRCSSVHTLDTNDTSTNAPSKTPTSISASYITASITQSQGQNQGNVMPGYPLQLPPQSQQSLHNSSGYPGQTIQPVQRRFLREDKNEEEGTKDCGGGSNERSRDESTNERSSLNVKLKTMILNKQLNQQLNYQLQEDQYPLQQQQQQQDQQMHQQQQHQQQQRIHMFQQQMQAQQYEQQQLQQFHQQEQLQQHNHQQQQQQQHQQQQHQHQQHQQQQHQQQIMHQYQNHQMMEANQLLSPNSDNQSEYYNPDYKQYDNGHFLARGHHLQNSHTEDGGYWDVSQKSPIQDRSFQYNYPPPPPSVDSGYSSTSVHSSPKSARTPEKDPWKYQLEIKKEDEYSGYNNYADFTSGNHRLHCGDKFGNHRSNEYFSNDQKPVKIECETQTEYNDQNMDKCKGKAEWKSKENHWEKYNESNIVKCEYNNQRSEFTNLDVKCEPEVSAFDKEEMERYKEVQKPEEPDCDCFPADKRPIEPGSYYTHLGAAPSLPKLRSHLERQTGFKGEQIRIEKILYTGKEGKTTQGCPLAKWIIRRSSMKEKILVIVKHRAGHECDTAWIVVILVAWDGVPSEEADISYSMLSDKLSRYGLATMRRCGTNESRSCACQGLNPDTCGASFSFGCSWSMYYNGCKYARSKNVRKFRLSVKSEESEVENRIHLLATSLTPLYRQLAPISYSHMILCEREGADCRLGFKPGRPWSGVTACVDFCTHTHRDMHNMYSGCTMVVSLTKHRGLSKSDNEQLHVLPLYVMDDTDEHGNKQRQYEKSANGSLEVLNKFPCEVRVRSVPLQPCRKHGKKRKDDAVPNNVEHAKIPVRRDLFKRSEDNKVNPAQWSQVWSGYPNYSPFDSANSMYTGQNWKANGSNESYAANEVPKTQLIGSVTGYIENEECFKDSEMGGVAIALGHGSVMFECAKYELHSTTALQRPDRADPSRISLVFYQHRNMNKPKHGWDEWEERMKLKKQLLSPKIEEKEDKVEKETIDKSRNYVMPSISWLTLLPVQQ